MTSMFLLTVAAAAGDAAAHVEEHHGVLDPANPKLWVAIAFILLMGLFVYLKVFRSLGTALDARGEKIKKELEEARALKEEAQTMLASFQRKQRDANKQAAELREQADSEAELLRQELRANLDTMIERRTRIAQDKITHAQDTAVAEVQAVAVNAATAAARTVIAQHLQDTTKQDGLIDAAITGLEQRLH